LEQREEKITTILITLKNNPALTARIVKSNAKKISQRYMDFLILNFYDSLQPKSCSCKSSLYVFEFIKELFIEETKYIENINDLVDCCPLVFKMINSLFNKVQLFDFLAVFLKKLLKKKYLKELVNEEYENMRQTRTHNRGRTSYKMFDGSFNNIQNWKMTSSKKYFAKFEDDQNKDFTKTTVRRKKQKKYEALINNIIQVKQNSSKKYLNSERLSTSLNLPENPEHRLTNFEQSMYDEMVLSQNSYKEQFHNMGGSKNTDFTFVLKDTALGKSFGKERG
jgi:hypothetical protein